MELTAEQQRQVQWFVNTKTYTRAALAVEIVTLKAELEAVQVDNAFTIGSLREEKEELEAVLESTKRIVQTLRAQLDVESDQIAGMAYLLGEHGRQLAHQRRFDIVHPIKERWRVE